MLTDLCVQLLLALLGSRASIFAGAARAETAATVAAAAADPRKVRRFVMSILRHNGVELGKKDYLGPS